MITGVPLTRKPIFPGATGSVKISNPEILKALHFDLKNGTPYFGVFFRKTEHKADPEFVGNPFKELYDVGTLVQVQQIIPIIHSSFVQVVFLAHRRLSIQDCVQIGPPLKLKVSHWKKPEAPPDSEMVLCQAYMNETLATLREIIKHSSLFREQSEYLNMSLERSEAKDPGQIADFAAMLTTADGHELQEILAEPVVHERLRRVLKILKTDLDSLKLQAKISEDVEQKMTKQQRDFMLWEQLKIIKKELGLTKEDQTSLIEKFHQNLEGKTVPPHAMEKINDEIEKFRSLEKNSAELNITRAYLEWLTLLPWSKTTEENFDLQRARQLLDEDHYGLEDIKKRILEFIAVGKLSTQPKGKIICLVGPPGVGKTSIGKSIARALNRKFYRFSVGGLSDVAEIKGHRRTYVGALPGKMIQCLKLTQSSNALVLIDEIDKIGKGYQGDPSSALLELLDPNQNTDFTDHYLDVSVDLSKILFVTTANVVETIPDPLKDRMEMLRLSGYDHPEKVEIAKKYLIPKLMKASGIVQEEETPESEGQEETPVEAAEESTAEESTAESEGPAYEITDEALEVLIKGYCRESGVRNLEQHLEKICRKMAFLRVVQQQMGPAEAAAFSTKLNGEPEFKNMETAHLVTTENLIEYVGQPKFRKDRLYEQVGPPGVVMGLAWTAMGGCSLYVEATALKPKDEKSGGDLQFTGQLGNVMSESVKIAFLVARQRLEGTAFGDFFQKHQIHLHVPEGATPKDGPSAGVTCITAFLSLAMNKPTRDVCMTGEVSLTGKVLPIGGVKEKTIAARRSGVKSIIFPEDNRKDFEELPDYLKDGLDVHFAKEYEDVYRAAFEPDT